MKKYTTLFFDLDNTLLDFYKSEHTAIMKLLEMHSLPCEDKYVQIYSKINQTYWERFERGEIDKSDIFEGRFITFLERLGEKRDTKKMSDDYFTLLSCGYDVCDGARDILEYAKAKGYTVCITTNGIAYTQKNRIENCGLKVYFDFVFISEDACHQKPEKEYFDYAIKNSAQKDKSKILIIGDSQSSDILGGINSGIDTCWLNKTNALRKYNPTYEITDLKELKKIL